MHTNTLTDHEKMLIVHLEKFYAKAKAKGWKPIKESIGIMDEEGNWRDMEILDPGGKKHWYSVGAKGVWFEPVCMVWAGTSQLVI